MRPREAEFETTGEGRRVASLEWVFTSPNEAVRAEKLRWVPATVETMVEAGREAGG